MKKRPKHKPYFWPLIEERETFEEVIAAIMERDGDEE